MQNLSITLLLKLVLTPKTRPILRLEVDAATARNSGMPCISVTWGLDKETLLAAGATTLCNTADEGWCKKFQIVALNLQPSAYVVERENVRLPYASQFI